MSATPAGERLKGSAVAPSLTQMERVLVLLREAGREGLCSLVLYGSYLPNGRNRVGELERERRFVISRSPCHHDEPTPTHVRYRIDHDPERRVQQMQWIG
jgi:hypothetical protein